MKLHALTKLTAAALVLITLVSCGEKEPKYGDPAVRVNPGTLVFDVNGGGQTVDLTATVAWSATTDASAWVTVAPVTGTPSKEVQKVSINVAANPGLERIGTVIFSQSDGKGTLSATLTISQSAFIPEIKETTVRYLNDSYKYQRFQLSGVVKNLKPDGAFDLVDATGTVVVSGLSAAEVAYGTNGGKLNNVNERDTVTIVGYVEMENGKPVIKYAYLVKVDNYSEPSLDDAETVTYPWSADFRSGVNKFFARNEVFPYAFDAIWTNSASEGWVAQAYNAAAKYTTESWLVSPFVDMASAKKPILVFNHVVQYFKDIDMARDQTSVWVREKGGNWKQLSLSFSYPDEQSSAAMTSQEINLSEYIGKTVQFAFKYVSDETNDAGKWQILDFTLKENEEKPQDNNTGGTEDYNNPGWNW